MNTFKFNTPFKPLLLSLTLFIFGLLGINSFAQADDWALTETHNLQKVANQAQKDHLPIIIYFSMQGCGACQKLRENVIDPLMNNGFLDGYVHMVQVTVDLKDSPLIDFYGEKSTGADLKAEYNITTVPTLVFLNPEGDSIASPMVRSGAYDYVPYYLQQHINKALKALGNPKRINLE